MTNSLNPLPPSVNNGAPVDELFSTPTALLNGGAYGEHDRCNGYGYSIPGYPDGPPSARPVYLLPHHAAQLAPIDSKVIAERGYRSEVTPSVLASYGYLGKNGKPPKWVKECVPALLVPVWNAAGEEFLVQIRPDHPRFKADGKPYKYETPPGFKMCVDVHPRIRHQIADPSIDLLITEGVKDSDSAVSRGLCCVALLGVWNWRGTGDGQGATVLPDWEHFAWKHKDGTPRKVRIAFDSDVTKKPEVAAAQKRFVAWLEWRGADVEVLLLPEGPNGEKTGLTEYFVRDGNTPESLLALGGKNEDVPKTSAEPEATPKLTPAEIRAAFKQAAASIATPGTLDDVKTAYRKWIYLEDDGSIEIVLGTVAANLMDGDAVWLMLVGASSGGKTEIVNPLLGLPFVREAAVLTESSLLSGSSKRDRAANAKGGLLREIGPFGFLILKDFTSILSMNKDAKTATLAALREVYDGSWTRQVGSDGGQELQWKGKLATVACCTEAIDEHHAVIGAMGERFAFFRLPPLTRLKMARRAVACTGSESQMREEMQKAVCGLFAGLDVPAAPYDLSDSEVLRLINLADFTARCRSAVIRDPHSRDISLVLESEYPARIAKILRRIFSGMLSIGVSRDRAWQLLTKIGFDSMHKTRRQVLEMLLKVSGESTTKTIALALDLPTTTTRRALEELTAHNVLKRDKAKSESEKGGGNVDAWMFSDWCIEALSHVLSKDEFDKYFPDFRESSLSQENESDFINHPNTVSDRKSGKNLDDMEVHRP